MRHVHIGDLEDPKRLISLLLDAERRGFVKQCEAGKLAFFAAAEHAKRVGTCNVPGLFASLVRKRRFAFITQSDEDVARRAIAFLRQGDRQIPNESRDTRRPRTARMNVESREIGRPRYCAGGTAFPTINQHLGSKRLG